MTRSIELFPFLTVNWFFVIGTVSESYTRSYNGYTFTYPVVNPYLSKDGAQTWCTQNGSNLLEIKSSYVQTLTVQFLSDTGFNFADGFLLLTGGVRNDSSWNWVSGRSINSITISGQTDLSKSFGYFRANASRLYIVAGTPIDQRAFICQGNYDCSQGFVIDGICHKTYTWPSTTWFDARNRCLNEGGDFASFDYVMDDTGLNSRPELNGSFFSSSTTYWIGIRRQWWTWQPSNVEVKYTNWPNGRPVYRLENACLCLIKSGTKCQWTDCNCNSPLPFLCMTEQSSLMTQFTNRTSSSSTTYSGFTEPYSNPHSSSSIMEAPLTSPTILGGKNDNVLALAIGLGIGIPAVLIILSAVIVIALMKRKLRYQARLVANVTRNVNTHNQLDVRRNHQLGTNGPLEMTAKESTSQYYELPYDSPQQERTSSDDHHNYEILFDAGRRKANDPASSEL